jgi:hypothetical protein
LYLHSLLSKDALTWTITEKFGIQYRVRFENSRASDKFAVFAGFWTYSRESGEYNNALRTIALGFAGSLWESEEEAFTEMDTITSTFALFSDSI